MTDNIPEMTAEEKEQKAQELKERAKDTKQELDKRQEEALQKISQGEDFEKYETVSLGELEVEVKAWLPGDTEEIVTRASELAEQENPGAVRESMESMLVALDEMTTNPDFGRSFWQKYYSEYGPEGLIVAVETILGPAIESAQDREESVKSFRQDK